jgi:hypothetical protein
MARKSRDMKSTGNKSNFIVLNKYQKGIFPPSIIKNQANYLKIETSLKTQNSLDQVQKIIKTTF